jgi:hypothetical protein
MAGHRREHVIMQSPENPHFSRWKVGSLSVTSPKDANKVILILVSIGLDRSELTPVLNRRLPEKERGWTSRKTSKAAVDEAGTTRFEIEAGRPRIRGRMSLRYQ